MLPNKGRMYLSPHSPTPNKSTKPHSDLSSSQSTNSIVGFHKEKIDWFKSTHIHGISLFPLMYGSKKSKKHDSYSNYPKKCLRVLY